VDFRDLPAATRNALEHRLRTERQAETVPFNDRLERMADAFGAIYGPDFFDETNDRARALDAAQAALDALEQSDANVASDRSGETSAD
jgi:formylmethanofuran:tetrahydromethanopterin formyltransferase